MKKLSSIDRDALTRALELTRDCSEPGRREQVDDMIKEQGRFAAALFCVYSCQFDSIRPKLWQPVPSDIDDIEGTLAKGDDGKAGRYVAAKLLKRMLRAGLSRYEPRPIEALAQAAAARRRRTDSEPAPTV